MNSGEYCPISPNALKHPSPSLLNENSESPNQSQSPPQSILGSPSNPILIEQPKASPSVTLHYKPNNPKVGVIKPKPNTFIPNSEADILRRSSDSEEILRYPDDTVIPYSNEGSPGYQMTKSPSYHMHSPPNYFNPSPPGHSGHSPTVNYPPPAPTKDVQNGFQPIQRHSPNYETGSTYPQQYARYSPSNYSESFHSNFSSDTPSSGSTFLNNYTKFLSCTSEFDSVPPTSSSSPTYESQVVSSGPIPSSAPLSSSCSQPIPNQTFLTKKFESIPSDFASINAPNFPSSSVYSSSDNQQSTSMFPSSSTALSIPNDFSNSNDVLGQSYFQPPPVLLSDSSRHSTSMCLPPEYHSNLQDGLLSSCNGNNLF